MSIFIQRYTKSLIIHSFYLRFSEKASAMSTISVTITKKLNISSTIYILYSDAKCSEGF